MKRQLLATILTALTWTLAAADPTSYQVEIIVFENLDPAALQTEQWPVDPGEPPLNNAMELNALTAAAAAAVANTTEIPPADETAGTQIDGTNTAPPANPAMPENGTASQTPASPDATQAATPESTPAQAAATDAAPPSDSSDQTSKSGMVVRHDDQATVDAGTPTTEEQVGPPAPPPLPAWRWLEPDQLKLQGDEEKLLASGHYKPVLHIGWIQPLDDSDQGTTVHIYDGMHPETPKPPATDTETTPAPANASDAQAPAETTEPPPVELPPIVEGAPSPEQAPTTETTTEPTDASGTQDQNAVEAPHIIDGTFTLRHGRYLHADVDLGYRTSYTPEAAPDATEPPPPVSLYVRMMQSRRILNDDLQYLDHPLFGVLFIVTPVEDETSTQDTTAQGK